MKIVMAVDNSEFSRRVLQAVCDQFQPADTEVRVLHVLQPIAPAPPQMSPGYAPELEDQKKPAQEFVDGLAEELRASNFKVSTAVEIGDTRERIVDFAEECGADLILVGSHGRHPIKRLLLGSVAEFVARHAKCSVQIVRARS